MEEIVANLKLQIAMQEQLTHSSSFVPNYTGQVKPNPCCGLSKRCSCAIQEPPRRCCNSPITDQLELLALQVATYNQYAPKRPCCNKY